MTDEEYMQEAINLARSAAELNEVPVGTIIVYNGEIISRANNANITASDATAHAELNAIRDACQKLNQKRIDGASIYVTKEPCPMCAGAMVLAHIERLIFGVSDPKSGAAGSVVNLVNHPQLNHRIQVTSGILETECRELLQQFFKKLRKEK
ncbi:MAG: tRNA adenosine(34) deaminase TadA [bacterium]|nr:tRNA adenosine(34) deaminase TadA [bacterium]